MENEQLRQKNDDSEYIIRGKLEEKDDLINKLKSKYDEEIPMLKQAVSDMQNLLRNPKETAKLVSNQAV
jgi:hypothetical protein